jgi:hypothetical protein
MSEEKAIIIDRFDVHDIHLGFPGTLDMEVEEFIRTPQTSTNKYYVDNYNIIADEIDLNWDKLVNVQSQLQTYRDNLANAKNAFNEAADADVPEQENEKIKAHREQIILTHKMSSIMNELCICKTLISGYEVCHKLLVTYIKKFEKDYS